MAQHPGGQDLAFKNLGGMLQLEVASASVKKIRISSNNSTPLAGTAEVTFTNDLPAIGTITNPGTAVTLNVSGAGTGYQAESSCCHADSGCALQSHPFQDTGETTCRTVSTGHGDTTGGNAQ